MLQSYFYSPPLDLRHRSRVSAGGESEAIPAPKHNDGQREKRELLDEEQETTVGILNKNLDSMPASNDNNNSTNGRGPLSFYFTQ